MKLSGIKTLNERFDLSEWIGDIPGLEDMEVHVRALGNAEYRALEQKMFQAIPYKKRKNGIPIADQDRIKAKCLLEAALLDWRNLVDDDGVVVPYSKELAESLLSGAGFREAVWQAAAMVGADAGEADEALAKNSSTSSAGA